MLAGDRSADRQRAKRHSRLVGFLKTALPVTALVTTVAYAGAIYSDNGWQDAAAMLTLPRVIPKELKMQNPYYEGFNDDGSKYWVKAENAMQDLKNLYRIRLEEITGELKDKDNKVTKLSAKAGVFDRRKELVTLQHDIKVRGADGLAADLLSAQIHMKKGLIESHEPVTVAMKAGTIRSQKMVIQQKEKIFTFEDDVRSVVQPSESKRAATTETENDGQISPFSTGKGPINISAARLQVNDVAKTAIYTGNVNVRQDKSTLMSPRLDVSYSGSATTAGEQAGQGAEASSQLERIVAVDPVEIQQADGSTVHGRDALFNARDKTAVIEGDVVISQPPATRLTADKLELDQNTSLIILSGRVAMRQGENLLKGERLEYHQKDRTMQLMPGTANKGRIFANFAQTGKKASKPSSASKTKGIPFASFKTDPNAPVQVQANQLNVDDTAKRAVFTGNVEAKQGTFVITSKLMTAFYIGSSGLNASSSTQANSNGKSSATLTRMEAKKNVRITSKDGQTAVGDWAKFNVAENTATLGGNVVLTQGKNVVRGTRLVIDMKTGRSVLNSEFSGSDGWAATSSGGRSSGRGSSRPSAVFYPGQMKKPPRRGN